jgi:hypothetical protein
MVSIEKLEHHDHDDLIKKTVDISRPVFTEENFEKFYKNSDYVGYKPISENIIKILGTVEKQLKSCLKCLKEYNAREYLLADMLAGLVVGFTHVSLS